MSDNLKTLRLHLIVFLILFAATFLAYCNSFNIPFHWDDVGFFGPTSKLKYIKDFSDIFGFQYYPSRPVANFFIALSYYTSGYDLSYWHLLTIIFQAIVGFYVYLLLGYLWPLATNKTLWPRTITLLIIALIYTVHPIHNETLNMFHYRSGLLATLFVVASLVYYLRAQYISTKHTWFWFLLSWICGLLACGSKEDAIVLPAVIFITDFYFITVLQKKPFSFQPIAWLKKYLPYCLVMTSIPLIMHYLPFSHNFSIGFDIEAESREYYYVKQLIAITLYFRYLFIPYPLNMDHDFRPDIASTLPFSLIIICLVVTFAYRYRKQVPLLAYGLLWYLLTKAPTSFALPMREQFAERFMHLPAIGFVIAACALISFFANKLLLKFSLQPLMLRYLKIGVFILVGAIIVAFIGINYNRNIVWQDPISLNVDITSKSPNKARAWSNLGHQLQIQHRVKDAVFAFKRARELQGDDPDGVVLANYGIALSMTGQYEEAEKTLLAVFKVPGNRRISASDDVVYFNLGVLSRDSGKPEKVIYYLNKISNYETYGPGRTYLIHRFYAEAYERQGLIADAINSYTRALNYSNEEALKIKVSIAQLRIKIGQIDQARTELEALAATSPMARSILNQIK
ncbi:MAG: hypothetical protein IT292_07345 [Deltaproteobacteria bacterium]|nr:hypothetical protein [Deltaproteobacteria bacterium]